MSFRLGEILNLKLLTFLRCLGCIRILLIIGCPKRIQLNFKQLPFPQILMPEMIRQIVRPLARFKLKVLKDFQVNIGKMSNLSTFRVTHNMVELINYKKYSKIFRKCGSCWSIATTSALSDRFCIASDADPNYDIRLSPSDLAACCSQCSLGKGG